MGLLSAESLQRITGVTIQRDFGEGERVAIRGTAPNLNLTLMNGHAVATADWFILDQLNASRSFNYLMLPSVEAHGSGASAAHACRCLPRACSALRRPWPSGCR